MAEVFKSFNHGIDFSSGKHKLKNVGLLNVKQETITQVQYDAIPTTGPSIADYDQRIFIVLVGAGMAFLATTNLNGDATALVKTKSGNDAQIAQILDTLAQLSTQVTSQGEAITVLTGRTNTLEVDAAALKTRVETAEGTIASQGTAITTQGTAIETNKTAQDTANTGFTQRIDDLVASGQLMGIMPISVANNIVSIPFKKLDGTIVTEDFSLASVAQDVQVGGIVEDANGFSFTIEQTAGGAPKQVNLAGIIEAYLVSVFQTKFDAALAASDALRVNTPQTLTDPQKASVRAKIGASAQADLQALSDRIGSFLNFKGPDGTTDITTVMEGLDTLFQKAVAQAVTIQQLQLATLKTELTNVTLAPGPNYFSPYGDATVAAPRISPAVRVLGPDGFEESYMPQTVILAGVRTLCIDNPTTGNLLGRTVAIDW